MTSAPMRDVLAGTRMLGAGFGVIVRSPRLLALGALPALISTVLLVGSIGVLVAVSPDVTGALTPFADHWPRFWRDGLRLLVGVVLVGGAALLGTVWFVALTLAIGGPCYEYLAEQVERRLGLDTSGDGAGAWRSLGRGLRDAVGVVLISLAGTVALLLIGCVPVAGQVVAPVLGALFGAWMIGLEMVGAVFLRRGLRLPDRHRALWRHRATVLGFGLPAYLLCLVPLAQLVVVPSAVVGGTLLAHRVLAAEPVREPTA